MLTSIFAAKLCDKNKLKHSSSGGIFTALSNVFLMNGQAVACCIYSYDTNTVEFRLITNLEDRDAAIGSKYVQSIPGRIFLQCKQWLERNVDKKLLFIGMGCQVDGFRNYAEALGFRDRVILVDLICYGSPSPMIWQKYAKTIEREHAGKIEFLTFKDKRNGWDHPTAMAIINGQEILISDYVKIFYSKCTLRPCCHKCPYTSVERKSDLTIGDFWGIEKTMPDFYDQNGVSIVLIHSEKGQAVFDQCKNSLDCRESNRHDCLQPNLIHPTAVSESRTIFWEDFSKNGIEYVMKKYGTNSLQSKVRRKITQIVRGGRISQ